MKFKRILFEKKNKIDLTNADHRGLILGWVKDFLMAFHYGNAKLVKEFRKSIDKEIKRLNLDRDEVYFYYGDMDDPKQKKDVYKAIGIND